MKTNELMGILLITGVLLFAGCTGSQTPTTTTTTMMTTITTIPSVGIIVTQTAAGPILTDGSGMTLYTFDNDAVGKSNCNGQCATVWPPLVTPDSGFASVPGDLTSDITHFLRDDAKTQAAYKGMPLYYYSGDSNPGDMKGDGVGGLWHVAKVNANQPTTTAMGSSTTIEVTATTFIGTPRTAYVNIDAFDFDPTPLTVTVGDTVIWKSVQSQMTVTSAGNASVRELDSPVLGPTETYSHTFTKVGTYDYYSTTTPQANGRIYVTADMNVSAS